MAEYKTDKERVEFIEQSIKETKSSDLLTYTEQIDRLPDHLKGTFIKACDLWDNKIILPKHEALAPRVLKEITMYQSEQTDSNLFGYHPYELSNFIISCIYDIAFAKYYKPEDSLMPYIQHLDGLIQRDIAAVKVCVETRAVRANYHGSDILVSLFMFYEYKEVPNDN